MFNRCDICGLALWKCECITDLDGNPLKTLRKREEVNHEVEVQGAVRQPAGRNVHAVGLRSTRNH